MLQSAPQPERYECPAASACIEFKARVIKSMLGRKEVKFALLFSTIALDNLDRFRGGDHNLHHRTPADHHEPF